MSERAGTPCVGACLYDGASLWRRRRGGRELLGKRLSIPVLSG